MKTLPRSAVRADGRFQSAMLMGFYHQDCVRSTFPGHLPACCREQGCKAFESSTRAMEVAFVALAAIALPPHDLLPQVYTPWKIGAARRLRPWNE
jgi:hypothetical protein